MSSKGLPQNSKSAMPPGGISFSLLGWGYFNDSLLAAGLMALMVAALHWSPTKWAISQRDHCRAGDFTTVLFAVITVIQFQRFSVHGIYEILRVTPYCFFPLLLTQVACVGQRIPLGALVYGMRKLPEGLRPVDVTPLYMVTCILASSPAVEKTGAYLVFWLSLIIMVVVRGSPRRFGAMQTVLALILALALTALALDTSGRVRRFAEGAVMYWLSQLPWSGGDPNQAVTAIGAIGRLKLSDQIRIRIRSESPVGVPLRLHQAAYDSYSFGNWKASAAPFEALDRDRHAASWSFGPNPDPAEEMLHLSFQHKRELSLLPLPPGTRRVSSAEIAEIQRNRFGTIMSESPPGALEFSVPKPGARASDVYGPVTPTDLAVPTAYAATMRTIGAEIGLDAGDQRQRSKAIQAFFLNKFSYSLIQPGRLGFRIPLTEFLTKTRRGHCELFATATVLLLRTAGIPARYAVGYIVDEFSTLESSYVARDRHAHAWALAYLEDRWQVIDTTPSSWFADEQSVVSDWQTLSDVVAWVRYRLQRLSRFDLEEHSQEALWLVPFLAALLYWRLRRSANAVRVKRPSPAATPAPDSDLLLELTAALRTRGHEPAPGDTIARFLARSAPAESNGVQLADLCRVYYRVRFGTASAGLSEELRLSVGRYVAGLR